LFYNKGSVVMASELEEDEIASIITEQESESTG
jgi:hypothetical protein